MRNTRDGRDRRARRGRAGRSGRGIGLAGSLVVHVGLLAALFAFGRRPAPAAPVESSDPGPLAISVTTWDMPLDAEGDELGDPPLRDEVTPLPRPWEARQGERDNPIAATVAPADADGRLRLAPAPDQGNAGSRPDEHAFRQDRSTLRSRGTDGADEMQSARLRTSRQPSSSQAIRREPKVGLGDAVRTLIPSRSPAAPPHLDRALALGGDPAVGSPTDPAPARPIPPVETARISDSPSLEHALGPLDTEQGARSFDTERRGPAADDQNARAASNERRPGLTDFSRPSAPVAVAGNEGKGPGQVPGAVPHASTGSAPTAFGARDAKLSGPDVAERTLDRRYDRYRSLVHDRVYNALEIPKALVLRLEQGVTILEFVIDGDGRLGDGPRIVKSSGFEEFDRAAVRAVRRAAPFPPLPDRQTARRFPVSMPVILDNPVIR